MLGMILLHLASGCAEPQPPPGPPVEESRVAVIRERPGSARLDGLRPIRGFAAGRDCTFMHCLEIALEAVGRPIGYDELMGVSGMAFRIQFRVDRWDAGNSDPLVGESCLPALFAAVGWDYEIRVVRRDDTAGVESLHRAIARSIEAGVPVLATNILPPEDWGLITGFRAPRTWLCRAYNGGAERFDMTATGWPTAVVLLTQRRPRPDPARSHVESIRGAVQLFDTRGNGPYALGAQAFEEWIRSLRAPRERAYIHANFWTYVCLIDARGAAVRYLKSIARELGVKDRYAAVAADWYDQEVRLLLQGLKHVPSEQLYPDFMPPAEVRNRQIDTLRQAKALEIKAIEALRQAL